MKSKPRPYIYLSLFLLLAAFWPYCQIAQTTGRPLALLENLGMYTWVNWLCVLGLLVNAFFTFNVFGLIKYTLPAQAVLLAYNNWLSSAHGFQYSPLTTSLGTLGFVAVIAFAFYKGDAINILRRPGLKWWATAPRYARNLPVVVHSKSIKNMRAKTYDLSLTGAFLCALDDSWNIKVNDEIIVTIEALGFFSHARVVRITFGHGNYPEGVGVQFIKTSEHARNLLKYFVSGKPENLLLNVPDSLEQQDGTQLSEPAKTTRPKTIVR